MDKLVSPSEDKRHYLKADVSANNPRGVDITQLGPPDVTDCDDGHHPNKVKLMTSYPLVWYKGHVCAVVQHDCKTFRYPLCKLPEEAFLKKTKTLKATSEWSDVKEAAQSIKEKASLLEKALGYILPELGDGDTIKKKLVDEKMSELMYSNKIVRARSKSTSTSDSIVEDYHRWLYEGKGQKKTRNTKKDYISTFHLLKDYEYDFGRTIGYSDIDDDFIEDLIDYCYDKRRSTDEHEYLTVGGLSNRTINKRLDCLFKFIRDTYTVFPVGLTEKHHLEVSPKDVIRLDADDIKKLMELEIEDSSLEYARDCLVFLCLTGLRYGDFAKIDRTYVKDNTIVLNTNKTKKGCRIPLFEQAKEIGEKYDYQFAPPCNQVVNKQIKRLLQQYDLFPEIVTSSFLAKERVVVEKPRRDYITCHTGRRSYVSMLAETGMNLTDIMSATGHTSVRMLQVYIDLFGKSRIDKFTAAEKELFG